MMVSDIRNFKIGEPTPNGRIYPASVIDQIKERIANKTCMIGDFQPDGKLALSDPRISFVVNIFESNGNWWVNYYRNYFPVAGEPHIPTVDIQGMGRVTKDGHVEDYIFIGFKFAYDWNAEVARLYDYD